MRNAILFALMFLVPGWNAWAGSVASAGPSKDEVWARVSIQGAEIWPLSAQGKCWDPCGWSRPRLPERQLKPYSWYLKKPAFRAMTSGWKAPDVRVLLTFGRGKQAVKLATPVASDTTTPRWTTSKLLRIDRKAGWSLAVHDMDAFGQRELIGGFEHQKLPQAFYRGGSLVLRKVGQIESLSLQIQLVTRRAAARSRPTPQAKPKARRLARAMPLKAAPVSPRQPTSPRPRARPAPRIAVAPKQRPPVNRRPKATPKPQTRAAKPKLMRVTIKGAWLWPVNASKRCWDLCFSKSTKMPRRGLPFFRSYYLNKSFKAAASGRRAPDAWLRIQIGKRSWTTPVQNNTLQPKWGYSFLAPVGAKDKIRIQVFDKDLFSSELMGSKQWSTMPAHWQNRQEVALGSFGQVERLTLQVASVVRSRQKMPLLRTATTFPSGVRFVRLTVVKAKIWPLTSEKKCWDTCTTWSQPKLPPRGLVPFRSYFKNSSFKALSKGRSAPDPRVKIQLGKYDVYVTPTQSNTVTPTWNASHVFRLRGNEAMTITVSDDDQNLASDLLRTYRSTRELMDRWAADTIGTFKTPRLPIKMLRGGTMILRNFGQVEYLELKIEPLPKRRVRPGCEGLYRVRIAEVGVFKTRADGRPWHAGVGSMSMPSPYATIWLGNQKLETAVAYKRLNAVYQASRIIPIRKNTALTIEVRDYTVGFQLSFDRQIKIPFLPLRIGIGMKNEPNSQVIGQTAFFSACSLIKRSRHGVVQLRSFGRSKKVVLFFDKVS